MSGGEYQYTYLRIESFADELNTKTPNRKRFQELLYRVADAAHDIEWVDSGDFSAGDENAAIERCFEGDIVSAVALRTIKDLRNDLDLIIKVVDR